MQGNMTRIGLIGGTGLDDWGDYDEEFRIDTPFGPPSATIRCYQVGRASLFFLPRHGAGHAIPPHAVNYRANLSAINTLHVESVIGVNAVGGIKESCPPGALVLPNQLIDYTCDRQHTFSDGPAAELQHAEFTHPFSPGLRDGLIEAARKHDIPLEDGGCMGVMQGPRLETAAEVRRLARDGCDMVGMTSMPEAGLARELGLPYVSLSVVANWAAGVSEEPITMEGIEQTLAETMVVARALISGFLQGLDG